MRVPALLVLATACSDDPEPGAPLARVDLALLDTHHTAAGAREHPHLRTFRPSLFVFSAAGTTYHEGFQLDSGTGYIESVPPGERYLLDDAEVIVSMAATIDLGRDRIGRPDPRRGDLPRLFVTGDGLAPWQPGVDTLVAVVPNLDLRREVGDDPGLPAAGGTQADAAFIFWGADPLVLRSEGDELYLFQWRAGVLASLRLANVEMDRFAPTQVTGTFAAAPTRTLDVTVAASGFTGAPAGTGLVLVDFGWSVHAGVHGARTGLGPTTVLVQGEVDARGGALHADYQDPYPEAWPRLLRLEAVVAADCRLPGTQSSTACRARALAIVDLADPAGIALPIGPARDLAIDGLPADRPLAGVRPAPVLSWQPPEHGMPAGYVVTLEGLTAVGLVTQAQTIARYTTTGTSVRLDLSQLQPGGVYTFTVTALAGDQLDLAAHPFRRGAPLYAVDAISASFTRD
jgi:hypothetical protein